MHVHIGLGNQQELNILNGIVKGIITSKCVEMAIVHQRVILKEFMKLGPIY